MNKSHFYYLKILQSALWLLLFYFLSRWMFLFWNFSLFQGQLKSHLFPAFLIGLRFDISAVAMTLSPALLLTFFWPQSKASVLWWQRVVFFSLLVPHLFLWTLNFIDIELIHFIGRRWTKEGLFLWKEVGGKGQNFLLSYWGLALPWLLAVIFFVYGLRRIIFSTTEEVSIVSKNTAEKPINKRALLGVAVSWKFVLQRTAWAFLPLILTVIGIRGGLQKKPLSFASANTFAAPMLNHLSVNSTFTFIKSMGLEKLPRFRYFTDTQEILSLLNGAQGEAVVMQRHPQANVVLIILESFSTEYTGVHADGKSWTPFLDSLAKKSLYFKKSFANGRRSIEGVGALLSGVPALMSEPFITSPFMTNSFVGLGSILDQQGYHTSFFHGGQNGTMYFDSFSKSAGIQNYFGLNEYPNKSDFDGVWGIWDRPFLQYMVSQLNQFPAPFFSTVFTLSSHQPFKVPENEKHKFTEGPVEILKSVAYADDALKDFFTEASKQVWFKNTLFVITADHTSMHFRENYKNLLGDYLVPLLFYFPGQDWAKVNTDQLVQQIDVMPSIIDFLDLKVQSRNYLGRSVFSNKKSHIAVFTDQDYVLFADGHRLQVNASDLVNNSNPPYQVQTFQWPWMQKVKIDTRPESSSILLQQDLQKHLQAQLQYFSDGLWDHRLYYPVGQ